MNTRDYREKRELAKQLYLKGETEIAKLANTFGVSKNTIRNWINKYKWKDELEEITNLEDDIKIAIKKALVRALSEYSRAPQDTALQSLVSLLRQYKKEIEPNRDFVEYLKKFLDWLVDFFLIKDESIAKAIQKEILGDGGIIEYFSERATS